MRLRKYIMNEISVKTCCGSERNGLGFLPGPLLKVHGLFGLGSGTLNLLAVISDQMAAENWGIRRKILPRLARGA